MANVNSFGSRVYRKWYLVVLLVVAVSFIIGLIFSVFLDKEFTLMNVLFPSLINTGLIWGGSMAIVVFVWNRFPWESKPLKHLVVEIALIVVFLTAFVALANLYYSWLYNLSYAEGLRENQNDILITALITFLIVTIHEAVFFYQQWKFHFSKSVKLEKDNIEARYNALKAQVNPHFLFNSLNSLVSLVEDKPEAEKYVLDLSEYLRYMITSSNRDMVPVGEELLIVEKYIRLQRLRFGNNFSVKVGVSEHAGSKFIPVLALQMLLENCFNHNVITHNNPLYIRVYDERDMLVVENNYQKKTRKESTGIGLKNIEGRYMLTGAAGIKIHNDSRKFVVSIPLLNKSES